MSKTPHDYDVTVGARLRAARKLAGYSQEKLGDAVNLSFQQIQKYEKGTNRIGASRLQQFATILNVQPSYFFAGLDTADDVTAPTTADLARDEIDMLRNWRGSPQAIRMAVANLLATTAQTDSQAVTA